MADEQTIHQEIVQLNQSTGMTDYLTDRDAQILLQWGEKQLRAIGTQVANNQAFLEASQKVRQLVKGVNVFVGQRATMDNEAQHRMLERISAIANDLHMKLSTEHLQALLGNPPEPTSDLTTILSQMPLDKNRTSEIPMVDLGTFESQLADSQAVEPESVAESAMLGSAILGGMHPEAEKDDTEEPFDTFSLEDVVGDLKDNVEDAVESIKETIADVAENLGITDKNTTMDDSLDNRIDNPYNSDDEDEPYE